MKRNMATDVEVDCPNPGCFFCIMKESNTLKRRAGIVKFFKNLPTHEDEGEVHAVISGLWNTAMAHPNEAELVDLGVFECMGALILKGINDRQWLNKGQNIYIPYYAAHIIGSFTMNVEGFSERAVRGGVIQPLMELLRGKLTWVEQRAAVRALDHIANFDSTFPYVASQHQILELAMELAVNAPEIVYTQFFQSAKNRLSYHCDLLTRGIGGVDMESRKAEEWASQLQCWSLQLINCFASRQDFLQGLCQPEFLMRLPSMWGGLVNENSPAGIGLLQTICQHKLGRLAVASCPGVIEGLCNISRSTDDWQYMAVHCLMWLLQDPSTRYKVMDRTIFAVADLVEIQRLGEHKKLGEQLMNVLLQETSPVMPPIGPKTKKILQELRALQQKLKWEKNVPKGDLHIKQAAAIVVKTEGNDKFSVGDIKGAAAKYTEALSLCPVRARKERIVLYGNRAQCYLLLQDHWAAVSDATRALSLHNPVNRHAKSLWRRAQAYDALGLSKESLLDAIMFVSECSQVAYEADLDIKHAHSVPDYAEQMVKKLMKSAWFFKEASQKHGGVEHNKLEDNDEGSEWETATDSDVEINYQNESDGDANIGSIFKGLTLDDLLRSNF